jgi:hypothetical protein
MEDNKKTVREIIIMIIIIQNRKIGVDTYKV